MYSIESQFAFDSAHCLNGHPGLCSFIHGHRWTVTVELEAENLRNGMVMDFTDLKLYLKELENKFDHNLIIEKGTVSDSFRLALDKEGFRHIEVNFRPTAENFSKYFFDDISFTFPGVKKVTVYETPTNKASYQKI